MGYSRVGLVIVSHDCGLASCGERPNSWVFCQYPHDLEAALSVLAVCDAEGNCQVCKSREEEVPHTQVFAFLADWQILQ